MTDLPKIVLPSDLKLGKFIQIYAEKQPFFRVGDKDSIHGILLLDFLDLANLPFQLMPDCVGGIVASSRGDNYELVGAGRLFQVKENFILHGVSNSYGVGPNQKHLDDLAPYLPERIKFIIDNT